MRVALCTVPMLGHLVPLLPYAEELLRRGHHVTIFHDSDPKYRQKIEQCGLSACESVMYTSQDKRSGKAIFDSIRSHYSSSNEAPDVIVHDFFAVDAADAADVLKVPAIGVFPNPRSINPWAATREEQAGLKWAVWNAMFCTGMEAVLARILWCNRSWTRRSRSLPILAEQDIYPSPYMPRHIIGCSSPALEFPNLPPAPLYRMVGPALSNAADPISDDISTWLDAQDEPIVYVAFGTMFRHTIESVIKLEADLSNLNVAVVWSLPKANQAMLANEILPQHWRVESFIPQVSLFRSGQISAFVTHCGSNSIYEALLCGVPMVCCPGMADQPANASRLAKAGVGFIAKKGDVGTALTQLLDNFPRVIKRSKELATELEAHKGAEQAVTWIESIVREGAPERAHSNPRRWSWWPMTLLAMALPIFVAFM